MKHLKRIAYPLLVLIIAASCSSPRYASAQNDGYYDDNGNYNDNRNNPEPDYNENRSYDDENYDQNYDQNNDDYGYDQDQDDYNNDDAYDNGDNYEEDPSDVTIDDFNNALSPYGRWEQSPSYGRVWIANEPGFVPYSTGGHWAYTSYGWTWASDYSWGWAPFHYGRWDYDPFYGWMWVPGHEWGPAWVSWRTGGGYYGWAPLGPGMDYGGGMNISYNRWVFAPNRYMGNPYIHRYYLQPRQNALIIRNTTVINNMRVYNNRKFIAGPSRIEVEKYIGHHINALRIANASHPGRTAIAKNTLQMYRPGVKAKIQQKLQNRSQDNTGRMAQDRANNFNRMNQDQNKQRQDQNITRQYQNRPDYNQQKQEQLQREKELNRQRQQQIQQQNQNNRQQNVPDNNRQRNRPPDQTDRTQSYERQRLMNNQGKMQEAYRQRKAEIKQPMFNRDQVSNNKGRSDGNPGRNDFSQQQRQQQPVYHQPQQLHDGSRDKNSKRNQ